ncbi:hypothetical protein Acsp03_17860 [Actinomadura sp. NBRC 104412]|uniref:hypothetical protein n=1 Tax=Actinomadura sp. NBRC 104412 TaxID=3032203 RepID=UPI0024A5D057|nr:hypothetical protein [Actinomadura sp. NBRC 104412]GLZ04320.1 hypothetical protein Acsp03_17860 [Actinomadura sp. NBRC 104412]
MLGETPPALEPRSECCPDRPGGVARPDTHYRELSEPYRGDGPHRMELNARHAPDGLVDLPAQWKADTAAGGPRSRLVACVYQESVGTRRRVKDRLYTHQSLNVRADPADATKVALLKATHIFELYEAKTGKPVGRVRVPGDVPCPAHYKENSGVSIFQEPDVEKLRAALRPYVERSVGA